MKLKTFTKVVKNPFCSSYKCKTLIININFISRFSFSKPSHREKKNLAFHLPINKTTFLPFLCIFINSVFLLSFLLIFYSSSYSAQLHHMQNFLIKFLLISSFCCRVMLSLYTQKYSHFSELINLAHTQKAQKGKITRCQQRAPPRVL